MPDLADLTIIRQALANQIRNRVQEGTNVTWYALGTNDQMSTPRISIEPATEYLRQFSTMGADGKATVSLVVVVEVDAADAETSALRLDRLIDIFHPASIVQAVNADRTLAGTVDDVTAIDVQWVDVGRAEIPLTVIYTKTGVNV